MSSVTANDYHDIKKALDPQLSPSGKTVAFVYQIPRSDEEYESTIYRVSTNDGTAEQFTIEDGVDSEPRFSPSGDRLAFVSTRGGSDDTPQLWVMPTDGGEARQVTQTVGGVSSISWAPDGSRIAFTQKVTPEERHESYDLHLDQDDNEDGYEREDPDPYVISRLVYRAEQEYFNGTRCHVYFVDLEMDQVERVTEGNHDYANPEWGTKNTLYYTAERSGDPDDNIVVDIDAYDTATGETELITQTTSRLPTIAATSDGRIAYTFSPKERASMRQNEIEVFDRETGESTIVTEDIDRTLSYHGGFEWGPDESNVYFAVPDQGVFTLYRVGHRDESTPERIVSGGHITEFAVGSSIVFVRSEWDHPGDVFLTSDDGEMVHRLTELNDKYLAETDLSKPEEIRFESDPGTEIQGWVLTPSDADADETFPMVVEIHGGPHGMWSTSGSMWQELQMLAAEGYVVFWCNPRGSTGYGEDYSMAIDRDWGPVTMRDIMAGVDQIVERDYVDEDNLFVTGGSFGGYMTGWIVGNSDRFDGAVSQRGVYNLTSLYGTTDLFKLVEWEFDTYPWDDRDLLWEQSPLAYAHQATTPTLLIHSENDYRTPISDGEAFYRILKKNSVDAQFVRYPREGHELSRSGEPGHVVDRLERIVEWFNGYSNHHDDEPVITTTRE